MLILRHPWCVTAKPDPTHFWVREGLATTRPGSGDVTWVPEASTIAKTYSDPMIESADRHPNPVVRLLALAALMVVGYICMRTLRLTNDWLNLVFACAFLLLPFFAIRPVRRLRRWPKVMAAVFLAPLLALSSCNLLLTVGCDIPAVVERLELNRELSSVQQGPNSAHLLWQRTAAGAVGPHGVVLEQRRFIAPGFYVVKVLDYFEGVSEGSLSAEGTNKIRLHIPQSGSHEEVDRVYSLKPRVYF